MAAPSSLPYMWEGRRWLPPTAAGAAPSPPRDSAGGEVAAFGDGNGGTHTFAVGKAAAAAAGGKMEARSSSYSPLHSATAAGVE